MTCCSDLLKSSFSKANKKCFSDSTVAEENRRKFTIDWKRKTPRSVCKIKVDDCLIKGNSSNKCDYVFVICPEQKFLFVELKGTDIMHGTKQILEAVKSFSSKYKIKKSQLEGHIVARKVAPAANQEFRKERLRVLRDHGFALTVHSGAHVYPIA